MSETKIKPENYWAHHVYKVEKNGKPFIAAILRRKYGDGFEDIDDIGDTEVRLGIERKRKQKKIWDNNPDSDTFQQRIPDPNDEGGQELDHFYMPQTDEILEEVSEMCSNVTNYEVGTQYFWLFHGKPSVEAGSLEELADLSNSDVMVNGVDGAKAKKVTKRSSRND